MNTKTNNKGWTVWLLHSPSRWLLDSLWALRLGLTLANVAHPIGVLLTSTESLVDCNALRIHVTGGNLAFFVVAVVLFCFPFFKATDFLHSPGAGNSLLYGLCKKTVKESTENCDGFFGNLLHTGHRNSRSLFFTPIIVHWGLPLYCLFKLAFISPILLIHGALFGSWWTPNWALLNPVARSNHVYMKLWRPDGIAIEAFPIAH